MMTENNFFTLCQKWSGFSDSKNIPKFFRQSFNVKDKKFVPYDELSAALKTEQLKNLIPHFFIDDKKQVCFAGNPEKHSEILDKVFALCSTDFSVFSNTYSQFNNAIILLNRLIASYWQQKGRFVILTMTWGNEETYGAAFSNVEKGSAVSVSTEGVNDWNCFKKGFLEMLKEIEPAEICWYGTVPEWIHKFYSLNDIVLIPKRFKRLQSKDLHQQLLF